MNRDLLGGLSVFLTIMREGSLRAAARRMGVGAPTVSHQLKALEDRLGVALLARTTRAIKLTEAGRALLTEAGPAFAQLDHAVAEARRVGGSRTGVLRLTATISSFHIAVEPSLHRFRARYPGIQLEWAFDEGLVDIVGAGMHAGLRTGDVLAPHMIALRLTDRLRSCYVATPDYLDAHGRPQHPRDLLSHSCIRYRTVSGNQVRPWQAIEGGQLQTIDAPSSLVFNSMDGVGQAARNGHGIAWRLREIMASDIERGALETVLDTYAPTVEPFYLYYPEQYRDYPPLRLFIETLRKTPEAS